MAKENPSHFCVVISPEEQTVNDRAALLDEARWTAGQEIRVRFMEGDDSLRQRVRAVAERWTAPGMAALKFLWVEDGPAEIRIAFQQGNGSWSYLGIHCQDIPEDEPTMNYGWLTPESPEDELQRVVLHEFGHALGLIHEHQNPNRPISWDREAVIADLSGPPNNWDLQTIEHNIFAQYDPATLSSTPTDPSSIMMYPIPARWTTDGFSAGLNRGLSETDKQFIRTAYPW